MSQATYTVQTDVPMPGPRNRYPFETMAAGASFEIVGEEESRKVRNAAYQFAKKVNKHAALKAAEAEIGRKLTSDERKLVEPLPKGAPGAVDFALRKLRVEGEGESAVPVYGLWRVS
jgi:hypothetical protein